MNSLEIIEKSILEYSSKQDREVKGIWGVDCLFNPKNNNRVFDYKFLISQTLNQGCAYSTNSEYSRDFLVKFMGRDFLESVISDIALKVCFFDSLYGVLFPPANKKRLIMDSDSHEKMKWRTHIILDEAIHLLGSVRNRRIVNVGVVGDILYTFKENGAEITGTDFRRASASSALFSSL